MPTVSVIVPVYKVEQYLPACVESVLTQSFSDFELLLVDDGSPDNCGAMCDAYAARDPRVRVIHRENGGLSAARNSGMEIAQGKYMTFIDSDDYVAPRYLEALLQAAEEADAEISVCRPLVFEDGSAPEPPAGDARPAPKTVSGREAVVALYQGKAELPVNACGKLFRSALISQLRFPEGRLHEDQAFVPIACFRAERVVSLPGALYFYRDRPGSITTRRFSLKRYDDVWAVDQCLAFFEARGEAEIVAAAQGKRERLLCSYAILARASGVTVPAEYAVPMGKALRCLRRQCSDDKYTYYLSMIHPNRVRPHAYLRKLKQLLGLGGSALTEKP